MTRPSFVIGLLFAAASSAVGQPPVVTEATRGDPAKWTEIKGARGRVVRLASDVPAKWVLAEEGGAADLEADSTGKGASVYSPVDGRFKIVATSEKGEPTRVVVVFGDVPPAPPNPPGPPPPNPPPESPLRVKLKAAFAVDVAAASTPAAKAKCKEDGLLIAELYKQAVALATSTEIRTAEDLLGRLRRARETLGLTGLPASRKAIGEAISAVLPTDPEAVLTDKHRADAAAIYAAVRDAMKEIASD